VAKLLSKNQPKQFKASLRKEIKQFLKDGNGINGQLTLLFMHLFLLQRRAKRWVFEALLS
jgi:hypothetical protein